MLRLLALSFAVFMTFSAAGCVSDPGSPYIPWWKGIPAQVLAPSSQEAHGWHAHRHGHTYQQDIQFSGGPLTSEPQSPADAPEPIEALPEAPY